MRRGCTGCFIPRSRSSRRCGPRVRPTPRARRISSGAASPAPSMRARRWSCCMTPRRCVNACRWACSTARRHLRGHCRFAGAVGTRIRRTVVVAALPRLYLGRSCTRTARTVDALYATPLPSGDLLQALDGLYLLDDGQAIEELRERQRATFSASTWSCRLRSSKHSTHAMLTPTRRKTYIFSPRLRPTGAASAASSSTRRIG